MVFLPFLAQNRAGSGNQRLLTFPQPPSREPFSRMTEQCVAKAETAWMLDGTEPHEGLSMYTLYILAADGEIASWGRHPRQAL